MKIYVDVGEQYPVYTFEREPDAYHSQELEVPEATVTRWERIIAEYAAVQEEIRKAAGDE